jgi:hypothetical protein
MYKVTYVSGPNLEIGNLLRSMISEINSSGGRIIHVMQSQSSTSAAVVVTVTIIYTTP